jgi:hypothetical protein
MELSYLLGNEERIGNSGADTTAVAPEEARPTEIGFIGDRMYEKGNTSKNRFHKGELHCDSHPKDIYSHPEKRIRPDIVTCSHSIV